MRLQDIESEYVSEFTKHYRDVDMSARWVMNRDGKLVLRVTIRGESGDLSMNDAIRAIATFKQRGRPVNRQGHVIQ